MGPWAVQLNGTPPLMSKYLVHKHFIIKFINISKIILYYA